MQEVHWDGVRRDLSQGEGQIDEVLVGFAHAGKAARADLQACRARIPDRREPILIGMGRDNLRVKALRAV